MILYTTHSIATIKAKHSVLLFCFRECGHGGTPGSCAIKPVSPLHPIESRLGSYVANVSVSSQAGGGAGGWIEVKGRVGVRRGRQASTVYKWRMKQKT